MADQPAAATAAAGGHDALPQSVAKVPQKAAPNPALRMMGRYSQISPVATELLKSPRNPKLSFTLTVS